MNSFTIIYTKDKRLVKAKAVLNNVDIPFFTGGIRKELLTPLDAMSRFLKLTKIEGLAPIKLIRSH